jgi:hypothetical protein
VHHATVLMTLPAALYLAWIRRRPSAKVLFLAAAAGLAGLSVYLYLPLRAAQHPILNWGDPETLERFWWHISGQQYRSIVAGGAPRGYGVRVQILAELVWRQLTPVGLVVALVGPIVLFRRYRDLFWFTLGIVGCDVAFVIVTDLGGPDIAGYYLPAFLAMSWCFAVGAQELAGRLGGLNRNWVVALVFAVALLPAVVNFSSNNRHQDRIAPLYVENSLRGVPPGSLVLSRDWNFTAPWLALRYAQGWDPGVAVIDTSFLRQSWYLPMIERQYPDLYRAASAEIAVYRPVLGLAEHHQSHSGKELDRTFLAVVQKFIHTKLEAGSRVFCTTQIDSNLMPDPATPHGLLYEYSEGAENVDLDVSGLLGGVPIDESANKVRLTYAVMLTIRGAYLINIGQTDEARRKLDLALRLDPGHDLAVKLRRMLAP